jgi:GTP:adenosylcobinamide-phosphate guanylyltransferase
MSGWTALLLAGQRPGPDRLATHFGEQWKALVDIGGEPMLSRVARTLLASPSVARIVVLAQDPAALTARPSTAWLAQEPRITFLPSQGSISLSVAAVAGSVAAPWPVLVTTADHPLLTPAMVDDFTGGAGAADVAVGVVAEDSLLAAYPDNVRTWLRFRGGAYSGANLFALTGPAAHAALTLWATVEQDRKKGWRLFAAFGPWLLLRLVARTLTLDAAFAAAGRRLALTARAVVLPQPEAGIDVDKPADHALASRILADRDNQ